MGISFVITTAGTKDQALSEVIDSIEFLKIPEYEVIIVGGLTTTIDRPNVRHIPFDESATPTAWLTRKKNLGAKASTYDVLVIMHDYLVLDPDWWIEFEKFGTDWDICVHRNTASAEQNYAWGNGWRAGPVPGYPELPWAMAIPWDIDCFIPYMAIQGSYWVIKRHVMLEAPLNEALLSGQEDDIEWSSRVVPGWLGQLPDQVGYHIVANPKCVARFNKYKPPYHGNPDWEQVQKKLDPLWNEIRSGYRRPGVYLYDGATRTVRKY